MTARDSAHLAEIWKPVPGYEHNYEVSNHGDVRSRPRKATAGGVLNPTVGKAGYLWIHLYSDGRRITRAVHQVVAAAFLGPRPMGQEVRHLDGDKQNCALSNLAYGTRSENGRDKRRHGTDRNVSKTHCPQGHPYDEANTYVNPAGGRRCRTCLGESVRRYRMRKGGVVPPLVVDLTKHQPRSTS